MGATLYSESQLASMYGSGPAAAIIAGRPGSGYSLAFSQAVDTTVPAALSGAKAIVETAGVGVTEVLGNTLTQPPQPTEMVEQMIGSGKASAVLFMEIWQGGTTVLGTGQLQFIYNGLYVT